MKSPEGTSQNIMGRIKILAKNRGQLLLFIVGLAFMLTIPLYSNNFWLTVIIMTFGMIIASLGIQVLTGYCGQMSAGHCGFIAIGAYASAILSYKLGWSVWITIPVATLVSGMVGILVGLASIRLKGFYLIISTIAAQVIILYVIVHWGGLTGGSYGMTAPAPKIGNFAFDRPSSYFYIALAGLVIATYLSFNLVRTNVGRAFIAIRDNELSAEAIGVNVTLHKLLAFFVGCGLAGLSGAVMAHARGVITPDSYSLFESFFYLSYIIVGGLGTITGAYFGVLFFVILNQILSQLLTALNAIFPAALSMLGPIMLLVLGATIVIFIIIEPLGLAYRWRLLVVRYRIWPFAPRY